MILINGNDLTLENVYDVAVKKEKIKLSSAAEQRVINCRNYVEKIISDKKTVYGLTTGFGKFSNIKIPVDQIEELQQNLILSHATGVGPDLPEDEVRAIMLLRINVLAKGYSGIRLTTLQTLIDMLNIHTFHAMAYYLGLSCSDDAYFDTSSLQQFHAQAIFGIKGFVFLTIITEYKTAIGQNTINIKNNQFDLCGFFQNIFHVINFSIYKEYR